MERTSILGSRVYAGTEIGDEPKANLWFGLAKVSLLILIVMLGFAFVSMKLGSVVNGWSERRMNQKRKEFSLMKLDMEIRNEPNVRLCSRE